MWVRVPPSLQDCHLAQLGRARNYTFVAGYVMSLITVEDESYFSLLSSGSWVRVPQWQQKNISASKTDRKGRQTSAHCTMVAASPMRNICSYLNENIIFLKG